MKRTYKIEKCINIEININDIIRIIDGSSFTIGEQEESYIIFPYPKVFKTNKETRFIDFRVKETNITDSVCMGVLGTVYLQDLIIEPINIETKEVIRIASRHVIKI